MGHSYIEAKMLGHSYLEPKYWVTDFYSQKILCQSYIEPKSTGAQLFRVKK